ncbi:hypothetical protein G6F37_013068 [Rhizopus arrhizus]|nr:hypothetical protein G6F38_013177 [Rhizopus arrhizus]KAG1139951.1 hypothetical protein G6F37_013068 [Rhizopus arrhizus]
MDLVDKPENSDETLDQKTFLTRRYHSQLNRFTQVKDIPAVYKNAAYTELEELALRANIPLNRYAANNVVEPNTYVTEQIDDIHPEENFDLELLPDLDASNELEQGNSNEVSITTSATTFSSSAASPLPPSPSGRTRSGTRPTSRRQNKKRRI